MLRRHESQKSSRSASDSGLASSPSRPNSSSLMPNTRACNTALEPVTSSPTAAQRACTSFSETRETSARRIGAITAGACEGARAPHRAMACASTRASNGRVGAASRVMRASATIASSSAGAAARCRSGRKAAARKSSSKALGCVLTSVLAPPSPSQAPLLPPPPDLGCALGVHAELSSWRAASRARGSMLLSDPRNSSALKAGVTAATRATRPGERAPTGSCTALAISSASSEPHSPRAARAPSTLGASDVVPPACGSLVIEIGGSGGGGVCCVAAVASSPKASRRTAFRARASRVSATCA
mmetsp:Transcript_11583/g.23354  ORF Transcript_11583/g.23354 Transcript_11583/m.23354 type:complete len:301 (-) Transcript_11583:52-954(-)